MFNATLHLDTVATVEQCDHGRAHLASVQLAWCIAHVYLEIVVVVVDIHISTYENYTYLYTHLELMILAVFTDRVLGHEVRAVRVGRVVGSVERYILQMWQYVTLAVSALARRYTLVLLAYQACWTVAPGEADVRQGRTCIRLGQISAARLTAASVTIVVYQRHRTRGSYAIVVISN